MPLLTILIGAALVVTGAIAYFVSDTSSLTALIPAAVGLLLVIAGLIARNPKLRKHAIHGALAVALLGALGSLMNVAQLGDLFAGTAERPGAVISSTVMLVLLVALITAGVRSFIAARRSRQASAVTS
ncbi:hypothetical protein [Pseudoclavibacter sp. VKM Ac-2888]|uniref:hypothetical protein n=1 Tax=Pseudoclavibacter sp. VKM Ac-2888 TaxID=2783830 RepID=UPI001889FB60|nr:hypothetical protein [Pseudoclavibacter sp. VKM Ac-2888]MBF4550753.1 hypothetical protein [Pseudoclavibacter sp. VKM Ac-2888]